MLWSLAILCFVLAPVHGRAVNISNTWVLPEEGFPVFYRYFRDRISWYEADAVCQFHHANLVTVDTTAQYDAVRAYLKELDISSAVWVGLIRSNPDGDFTWTDYRGLSGDGYWSAAPDPGAAPLCAAADPAADYRWEARSCGGPTVASFICELPVPQWALGKEGCMVKSLPALTVLYLPESAAVQLTADCGLAGVKKIQCTGNIKRDELLRGLSCSEDDDTMTTSNGTIFSTTPISPSEITFIDSDLISDTSTEDNLTTEHEDDINQLSTVKPNVSTYESTTLFLNESSIQSVKLNQNTDKHPNYNAQNNETSATNDNNTSSEFTKPERHNNKDHKKLHDKMTHLESIETVFTQPTDHFIPPLVMAKAKISDDMTVLTLEEKHAQQIAEEIKHLHFNDKINYVNNMVTTDTVNEGSKTSAAEKISITTMLPEIQNHIPKKGVLKSAVPKKYTEKLYGFKNKVSKPIEQKVTNNLKATEMYSTSSESPKSILTTTPIPTSEINYSKNAEYEPTVDLTVIIKENRINNNSKPNIHIVQNDTYLKEPEIKISNSDESDGKITQEISVKIPTKFENNVTVSHEVIKITILNEENTSNLPNEFEVTTRAHTFDNEIIQSTAESILKESATETTKLNDETTTHKYLTDPTSKTTTEKTVSTTQSNIFVSTATSNITVTRDTLYSNTTNPSTTISSLNDDDTGNKNNTVTTYTQHSDEEFEIDSHEDHDKNSTDLSETIDYFQSPLLSGANEPLHRPNRSRRPQPPNRISKFNPFRILG